MDIIKNGVKPLESEMQGVIYNHDGKCVAIIGCVDISVADQKAFAHRLVECINVMAGIANPTDFVALAHGHRAACIQWETLLMELVGEDGPASVRVAIEKLKSLSSERFDRVCELAKQLDEMTATRDQISNVLNTITAERDTMLEERKGLRIELETHKAKAESDRQYLAQLQFIIDTKKSRHEKMMSGDYFTTGDLCNIFACRMQTKLTRLRDRIACAFYRLKTKFA